MGLARVLVFLVLPTLLAAQETVGSIGGRVLDPTGAAIVGAEVSAVQTETGAERKTRSAADGLYSFPDLSIGPYSITVTHTGFKKAIEQGLALHVSERVGKDIVLQVGEMTQEVLVSDTGEQVQTETGDQSSLISGDQVRELQLNGRSFFTLLELVPGVASNMADRTDPNSEPSVAINGVRSSASSFSVDGGSNSDVIVGSSSMNTFTSVETIAEFTVVTSPYAAEHGRGGMSQVNVVTKSGARKFHFSLSEFVRNDAFDATDYFSHQTLPLKLNDFGYTLSGPVTLPHYNRDRRKTFFFWSQQFNRIATAPAAVNTTVPTALERAGDFTPLGPGKDGVYGTADDPVIDPANKNLGFPDGKIPASRIDPNSRKLMALYPLPNFTGPGSINYTSAAASRQQWREEMVKIDHNFSDRFKIYGRYVQDAFALQNPYGGTALSSVTTRFPGLANTDGRRPGKNAVLSAFHSISPTLFQQMQITYGRRYYDLHPVSTLANRTALGVTLPELFPENVGNVIPGISLGSNYAALSPYHVGHKELNDIEVTENVTKSYRTHNLKFGGIYSWGANLEQSNNINTGGTYSFTTSFTKNPVANFLTGYPNQYTEVERPMVSHARFAMFEAYVQDDWKVMRGLTLNYGLRYSNYYNPWDALGNMTNFIPALWDPAKAPQVVRSSGTLVDNTGDPLNGIVVQNRNSPFGDRIANNNTGLLGPRLSFAWSPFRTNRTVVRGGWGMFYTRPLIGSFINNSFTNPPFTRTVTLNQPSYTTLGGGTSAPLSPPSLVAIDPYIKAPTVHRFSLGMQREVIRRHLLDVSYVGTRSLRLLHPVNINNPEAGSVPSGVSVHAMRPYLGWGTIDQRQSSADAIYHSLQVTFRRQAAGRFTYGLAYTWSKSIDNASSDRSATDQPPDSTNFRAERGPSDFDRTHVLTANFIARLPGMHRTPFLRGWELSGIVREWSGTPFDVQMSSDVAGIGSVQNQRPNVIGNTKGPRTAEQWFNVNAFARPKSGSFGNMGRNSLRGPGLNKWDLAIYKNFVIAERYRPQFRAEFFNAFNHPSFTTIGTSLNTTSTAVNPALNSFGVVTGSRDARVAQLALKLYF